MKTNADANELAGALKARAGEDAGKGSLQTSVGLCTIHSELVLHDQVEKLRKISQFQ